MARDLSYEGFARLAIRWARRYRPQEYRAYCIAKGELIQEHGATLGKYFLARQLHQQWVSEATANEIARQLPIIEIKE